MVRQTLSIEDKSYVCDGPTPFFRDRPLTRRGGYYASWSIIADKLYLMDLSFNVGNRIYEDFVGFSESALPLPATWVACSATIYGGRKLEDVRGDTYEQHRTFKIE